MLFAAALALQACNTAGPLGERPSVYSGKLELDRDSPPEEPRYVLIRPGLITGGPIPIDISAVQQEAESLEGRFVDVFGSIEPDEDQRRTINATLIRRQP